MTHRLASYAALAAWVAATWLALLVIPYVVADDALDPSWMMVNADDLLRGRRAGVESVFVHGPLGYLSLVTRVHVPGVFPAKVVAELLLKLACACVLAAACRDVRGRWARVAFLSACFLLAPCWNEALFVLVVALAGVRAVRAERPGVLPSAALVAVGAFLALGKFTLFLQVHATVLLVAAVWAWRGRRAAAGALLLGHAAAWCTGWWLAGQDLADVPAWLAGSLELARGHGTAMAVPSGAGVWLVALAAAVGVLLVSAAPTLSWPAAAALALGALVAWKQAVVRQDAGHLVTLPLFAAPVCVLLASHGTGRGRRVAAVRSAAALAVALAATSGAVALWHRFAPLPHHFPGGIVRNLTDNARILTVLDVAGTWLDAARAQMRAADAAGWVREAVGGASVDHAGNAPGRLLLHGLELHHRPVFQAYLAYTPALQHRNAAFYAGPDAPEFVLFRLETVDQRPPLAQDALVPPLLLARYRPVRLEGDDLLLARRREEGGAPAPREQVLRADVPLGTWVELGELPPAVHELALEVSPSFAGRARAAIYQGANLALELRARGGRRETWRITPDLVREGFVADPLVRTTADFAALLQDGGAALERLAAVRVVPVDGAAWFAPGCTVTLWRRAAPAGGR